MGGMAMTYWMSQLVHSFPGLVVYLIAFVLALTYIRRAYLPSVLTMAGVAVLVLTTIAMSGVQAYLMQAKHSPAQIVEQMYVVSIAGSCVRAVGLSLLVGAIFVGRDRGAS